MMRWGWKMNEWKRRGWCLFVLTVAPSFVSPLFHFVRQPISSLLELKCAKINDHSFTLSIFGLFSLPRHPQTPLNLVDGASTLLLCNCIKKRRDWCKSHWSNKRTRRRTTTRGDDDGSVLLSFIVVLLVLLLLLLLSRGCACGVWRVMWCINSRKIEKTKSGKLRESR